MKYKTEALGVAYELAKDIYEVGGMTESEMSEFERDCLVPEESAATAAPRRGSAPDTGGRPARPGRRRTAASPA